MKELTSGEFSLRRAPGLTDRLAWGAAVLHELCGMPFPNSFGHSQEVHFSKLS